MTSIWSILVGFIILLIFGLISISAYTALFFRLFSLQKISRKRLLLAIISMTIGWILAVIIGVMFAATAGFLILAGVLFGSIFLIAYLLGSFLGFTNKHKVFYSFLLAAIINPIWYFILV